MPVAYFRDDEQARITVIVSGAITRDEIFAVVDRQVSEGTWRYGVLYDSRTSTEVPTHDDVLAMLRQVGRFTARRGPRGPVALVVHHSELARMVTRYAQLGDLTALRVAIFDRVEDAERWLGEQMHL